MDASSAVSGEGDSALRLFVFRALGVIVWSRPIRASLVVAGACARPSFVNLEPEGQPGGRLLRLIPLGLANRRIKK
jgi:hypothetical protein